MMNGMFWVLRSGSAWRDMPERCSKWQTIYDRFGRWCRDGTLDRSADTLRERLRGEAVARGGLAEEAGGGQGLQRPRRAVLAEQPRDRFGDPAAERPDRMAGQGPFHHRRAYRQRSVVEHCVGWIKESRRLGTRYDKLAQSFLGIVTLAFIRRHLKLLHPAHPKQGRKFGHDVSRNCCPRSWAT